MAITNAIMAVAEGRVDLALAGGADVLMGAEALVGSAVSEGAAFLVLVPADTSTITAGIPVEPVEEEARSVEGGGEMGAALVPVLLARRWLSGERGFSVGGIQIA